MVNVAPAVAERIRRPLPKDLAVLPGSLPVVSFGDLDGATVATVSLNPSWQEFQSKSGEWLRGKDRRLTSLVSLGMTDPRDLDDDQVLQVVTDSNNYFRGPNWYKRWFNWLQSSLVNSGAGSYLDGSACHLDLVQWATKPVQRQLSRPIWDRLVEQDSSFLHSQLRNSLINVALLDGASVVEWIRRAGLVSEFDEDGFAFQTQSGSGRLRLFQAVARDVLFLGWNRPLASAIAADGRRRLVRWIARELELHRSAS
jgi:hypothetical protein